MNNTLKLLCLLYAGLLNSACQSQEKPVVNLDPIVQRAKETSLYSENVNWKEVDQKFKELTGQQETLAGLKPGLEYLINSLGDKHATFRSAKDFSILASYTGPRDKEDKRDGNFINTVINDISAEFSYDLIDDVGYLKVVGINPALNVQEQAMLINNGLKDLKGKGVDKWILDLRYNGGGNINPMIAGLAPLIGDGFIGGGVDAQGTLVRNYEIKAGLFYDTENLVSEMDDLPVFQDHEKVAVLLSRYTTSSGEMLAIAFKGRKNTRFIGEATSGYVTGNGFDRIGEELLMIISQTIFVDRNEVVYDQNVGVDEAMEFVPTDDKSKDLQIQKAISWLNN